MIIEVLILVAAIYFFITLTVFQRKYLVKYTSSVKGRMAAQFTMLPYLLFLERDKSLFPWIIQVWISIALFVLLIIFK